MEEIETIEHNDEIVGWGAIATLMGKAAENAEKHGREDVVDMLSNTFDLMERIKKPYELFFDAFQFAWRMYYRTKNIGDIPINRVTLEKRNNEDVYVVTNYDYKMFLWAKSKGFGATISNTEFTATISSLTPAERSRFEKQAKK